MKEKKRTNQRRQGVDNCTFDITFTPIKKTIIETKLLISPKGNTYGFVGMSGTKCVVSICIPHYIRKTNANPFGENDMNYIVTDPKHSVVIYQV